MAAQALKVNPQGNQYKKETTKLAAGSLSDPWVDGYGDRIETKKPGATSTEQTARQTDPPPQRRIAIREQGQCNQFDTQREVKRKGLLLASCTILEQDGKGIRPTPTIGNGPSQLRRRGFRAATGGHRQIARGGEAEARRGAAVVDDSAQEQSVVDSDRRLGLGVELGGVELLIATTTGSGLMTSPSTDKLFNHQGIDEASQSKLFSRGLSLFITTICNKVFTCPPRSIPTATPIDHSRFGTD
ncbi:predicted protein [Histoplasma capsulatum H143]|uniref:Uncharacterized protein n=1 Tax=Ajellomyces capsulatus (strain H143) TaxID=544712 RepID=C6HKH4_AJECH|nr:predicted protein [Histoplasma capsulatum H143]